MIKSLGIAKKIIRLIPGDDVSDSVGVEWHLLAAKLTSHIVNCLFLMSVWRECVLFKVTEITDYNLRCRTVNPEH